MSCEASMAQSLHCTTVEMTAGAGWWGVKARTVGMTAGAE